MLLVAIRGRHHSIGLCSSLFLSVQISVQLNQVVIKVAKVKLDSDIGICDRPTKTIVSDVFLDLGDLPFCKSHKIWHPRVKLSRVL